MEKTIEKKIRDLILNKKIGSIDKLIGIYKMIDDDPDISALAKALDVEEMFLENWQPTEIPKDLKPTKSLLSQYIDLFTEFHKKIHGRGFDYDPKEIGQLKNCMKKFPDLEKWKHVLLLVEYANEAIKKKGVYKMTWKFIVDNLKPSIIYSQRNFISNEEIRVDNLMKNRPKERKEWDW